MFSKKGGFGRKRTSNISSWKEKDGEDSATALQGAGTWMLGEAGTKLAKKPARRLYQGWVKDPGMWEKQLPKKDSHSKAGMHLCQQNDVNSLDQRGEPERFSVITGSLYFHRRCAWSRAVIRGISSGCRITLPLGRLWGGRGELGVKARVHFPTPRLPPLLQCSVPLRLTGINDSWLMEKLRCFSG